jgi:putative NIF3 family GTP cyclohydrolase 1 type 2
VEVVTMVMTARDVADVLEEIAPLSSGLPGDQLGFQFGKPEQDITGVACMWAAHTTSIRAAVEQGLNMFICHEALWSRPDDSPWYAVPHVGEIVVNELRRKLLEQHNVVVYRAHSNWDALPVDGVPDQAVAALGIAQLVEVARERFFSVQELPRPMTARELRDQAAQGLGYQGCRLFGDADQVIHRFAFLIGGFGENQLHMPQVARALGAEALIIGEMSEFIVMDAMEMGMPVIETLHSITENPAIRRQAAMLAERLPDLPVRFVPSGALAFR